MIDVELDNYINDVKPLMFEWGKLDCIHFAADWAVLVTGYSAATEHKGKYDDEDSAMKLLKDKFGGLRGVFDADFKRVDTEYRQKGDIALCRVDGRHTIGIVAGRGFVFFKHLEKGVTAQRDAKILYVWRVE